MQAVFRLRIPWPRDRLAWQHAVCRLRRPTVSPSISGGKIRRASLKNHGRNRFSRRSIPGSLTARSSYPPAYHWPLVKHDGRAEAALIANYGLRQTGGIARAA